MLTTISYIQTIPQLNNIAAVPIAMLNRLIGAADKSIKRYCKQNLELLNYIDYENGSQQLNLVLKQCPVWQAQTTLDPSMSGVNLPQSTITVASTAGFPPGTFLDTSLNPPSLAIQTGITTWATVTYTGITATTFTGCSGGTGTMGGSPNNYVATPCVWLDPSGFRGQRAGGFGPKTLLVQGQDYTVETDNSFGTSGSIASTQGGQSRRGLLKRVAGTGGGGGFANFLPDSMYRGKLASYRYPVWQQGFGNIKVAYTAGYYPIPEDLQYAAAMLVAQMVRILPNGANLSSESLGGYSYSTLVNSEDPEMGEVRRTLAYYRDVSWGPAVA